MFGEAYVRIRVNDHYDRIGERDAKYTRELCIRMVRVITLVRHVGRPVKIRTTFAPAPIVSLSFFYPSLRTRVVKKKKGQIVEAAFA